jgi:hypothetical protein
MCCHRDRFERDDRIIAVEQNAMLLRDHADELNELARQIFGRACWVYTTPFLGLTRWRLTKRRNGLSLNVSASVPLNNIAEIDAGARHLCHALLI